jgi:pimeloyl-ACP methyl ester carboxylesterase
MITQALRRIDVDDAQLEYEERGRGEPVLLIHGSIFAEAFAPLLAEPALTDRYRAISYHRRGFAGSARPGGELSIARQASDAKSVLSHLGVSRAHIVGHSYGGAIALQLALDAPDVVHTLALLEPAMPAGPAFEQFFVNVIQPSIQQYEAGDKAGAIDLFLHGVIGAEARASLDRLLPGGIEQAVADADTFFQIELLALQGCRFAAEEAGRIRQPALVVHGGRSDAVAPVFGAIDAQLRHWLPRAEPFVLSNATHALQIMNPGGMAGGLVDFFARHPMGMPN